MASSEETLKTPGSTSDVRGPEFAYLCVDGFMNDILSACALSTAFETGLVDSLLLERALPVDGLPRRLGLEENGFTLLAALLEKSGVLTTGGFGVRLTEPFRRALGFRDLLQMKLSTARFGAHDLLDRFTEMIRHPRESIGRLDYCRLFAYNRGVEDTGENYERTKRWMHITTTLTRYEAPVSMLYYDFGRHARMLDIGGNSGEFLLQVLRRHLRLQGTVLDLPVVCRVGREHAAGRPGGERITFTGGDALRDPLPAGFDLVSFKSMLHDWPDEQAGRLLLNGSKALKPGGTLLIFERAALAPGEAPLSFSAIPSLLFFGAFRPAAFYENALKELGFSEIKTLRIDLEMPFHLITAQKVGREVSKA
jgi:SAM-dependent methyltransferase